MIPVANPWKVLTVGGRKESDDRVTVTGLIDRRLPDTVVAVLVLLSATGVDLLGLVHQLLDVTTAIALKI